MDRKQVIYNTIIINSNNWSKKKINQEPLDLYLEDQELEFPQLKVQYFNYNKGNNNCNNNRKCQNKMVKNHTYKIQIMLVVNINSISKT